MDDKKLSLLIDKADIETGAWEQIELTLERPWLKRLAIMPDVHEGYDLPIGAVALTEGVVSPSFVGFDIGCGMCHIDTSLRPEDIHLGEHSLATEEGREQALMNITGAIPMGLGCKHPAPDPDCPQFMSASGSPWLTEAVNALAPYQYCTLGGGNHFIEIGTHDTTGTVCVTIHSGSRKPGHQIAEFYVGLCSLYSDRPTAEKSYLQTDSSLGQAYMHDMLWAQDYALQNRLAMMETVLIEALQLDPGWVSSLIHTRLINENHNHAETFGAGLIIHRKGATPAAKGQYGIIPGSMATGVYITQGRGNGHFLNSASHGAGRVMSRGQARRTIRMEDFITAMEGVTARIRPEFLDEAPQAYKDLDWVINQQKGVVIDVVYHITPIISVKG